MTGNTGKSIMATFVASVLAVAAVGYLVSLIVWVVAGRIDALSLSWNESTAIGFGYVMLRIVDVAAWTRSRDR